MNTTTLISPKYQMVIPRDLRSKLKIKVGTRVSTDIVDDRHFLVTIQPIDYVEALSGLGKDVWKKLGGADAYIKRERASWDKKLP